MLSTSAAFADSNQYITYQGRILRPDGTPLSGNIQFNIKVYSPAPSNCLLWAESQTLPMVAAANGAFALQIGRNSNRTTGANGGAASTFNQVFINNPNLTINASQCDSGSTYTPNLNDDRNLSVTFVDQGQSVKVVDLPIKAVPFALQAEQIAGYSINYLFKIAGMAQAGDKNSGLFTRDAMNILWELSHNQSMNGNRIQNVGTPTGANDAATKAYVDSALGSVGTTAISNISADAPLAVASSGTTRVISLGTVGTAGTYGSEVLVPQITVDAWGRITLAEDKAIPLASTTAPGLVRIDTSTGLTINGGTLGLNLSNLGGSNFGNQAQNTVFSGPVSGGSGVPSFRLLQEADIPTLTAAGKVANSATTAASANTASAIVARDASGSFVANDATLNSVSLDNGSGLSVILKTPVALTPYTLTLPQNQGNANDILSVDALGNLVWTSMSGAGSVTGVDLSLPSELTVTSAPITAGAGTLSASWANQNQNLVFASPTGAAGTPSFRSLVASDIPGLDISKLTSGTLGTQFGGTGLDASTAANGQLLIGNGSGFSLNTLTAGSGISIVNSAGSISISSTLAGGTVTNIGAIVPSYMTVSPASITSSGTFDFSFNSQSAAMVFASPTGAAGAPTFRALAASDIPSLDASKIGSGTLGVTRGGTGLVPAAGDANKVYGINAAGDNGEYKSLVAGTGVTVDLSTPGQISISASGSGGTVTEVTAGTGLLGGSITNAGTLSVDVGLTDGKIVQVGSGDKIPVSLIPNLDTSILTSGTLGVTRGGTGLDASAAADGQLLIGNGSGFSLNTLTAGSGISIVNSAGSISISSTLAGGTVTNIGALVPSYMTVSPAAITSSGTFDFSFNSQSAAMVFASPTGVAGAPTFRALAASDIPSLDASKIGTGTLGVDRGGTGLVPAVGDANKVYGINAAGDNGEYKSLVAGTGVTVDLSTPGQISISATGSGGTVTNVGLTAPTSVFSVANSPVTGAGTMDLSLNSQAASSVFAAPVGSTGVPSFRALAAADIPALDISKLTSGTLGTQLGGTGLDASAAADGQLLIGNGSGFSLNTLTAGSGINIVNTAGSISISSTLAGGTVTNIGAIVPSYMTVSPATITSSGTFDFSFNSQSAAMVFASPTGAAGAPTFRALAASDIPSLDASKIGTGTLGVTRGGTGLVPAAGDANKVYGINAAGDNGEYKSLVAGTGVTVDLSTPGQISISATGSGGTLTEVTAGTGLLGGSITNAGTLSVDVGLTDGKIVQVGSGDKIPVSLIPNLDASILTSGTLGVNRGGTGLDASAAANGQLLIGNGSGFSLNTLTAGSGINIVNSAGSISISSTLAGGTVTEIGAIVPSYMTVSPASITSSGTFDFSFNSQNAAMVFASPTGATGAPTFRALTASDIPSLDASKIGSGTLGVTRGGTGLVPAAGDANKVYGINAAGDNGEYKSLIAGTGVSVDLSTPGQISISATGSGGTVTNVGLTAPTSVFSVANSPVTGAGTMDLSLNSQAASTVFAAPVGSAGVPSFRTLTAADIPALDISKLTSGTLGTQNGGTGLDTSSAANGQLLIGNGSGFSLNTLTAGSGISIVNTAGSISISSTLAGGTVTDIGAVVPSYMTVSPASITSSGTFDFSFNSQNAAMIFASPTGASGAPTFRALAASDIPSLDASKIGSGTLGVDRGGTGLVPVVGDANKVYGINAAGTASEFKSLIAGSGVTVDLSAPGQISISASGSGGTVTEIGATVPSYMTVSPGSITSNGTFDFSFNSQSAAMIFASPTGASGAPTFRALAASDIPALDAAKITTGTLPVSRGGTGLASYSPYGILAANMTGDAIEQRTCSAGEILVWQVATGWTCEAKTAGSVSSVDMSMPSIFSVAGGPVTSIGTFNVSLQSQAANTVFAAPTGGSGAPTFRTLASSDIPSLDASKIASGTLGANRGGTGLDASAAADGQLLIGNGSGFSLNTLTAGSGINIVNSAGSISISSTLAGGTVTNIGAIVPSYMTVSPTSITSSGTFDFSFNSQAQALVFASPTGATGVPTFRALASVDIPSLDASKIGSGTLGVDRGGTGLVPAAGNANQLYGINGSGSAAEFKTLVAGTGLSITNSAGTISLSVGSTGVGQWTSVANGIHYSSGSVGIGTNDPYATLDIRSAVPTFNISNSSLAKGSNFVGSLAFKDNVNVTVGDIGFQGSRDLLIRNTDQGINFATNDTIGRLYIAADGKIGMGTLSPTAALDLAMTGTASALRIPRDTAANRPTGGSAAALQGMMRYNTDSSKYEVYEGTTGWISLATGSFGTGDFKADGTVPMTGNLRLNGNWLSNDGNSEGISVLNSGLVIAGTTTSNPSFTNNPTMIISRASAEAPPYLEFLHYDNDTAMIGMAADGFFTMASEDSLSGIKFKTNGTWGSTQYIDGSSTAMTILNNGRVGVGTTSPTAAFDVTATGTASAIRIPRDTAANRPTGGSAAALQGMMRYNTDSNKYEVYENSGWASLSTGTAGASQWSNVAQGISYSSGSVGVGTATPAAKFNITPDGNTYALRMDGSTNADRGLYLGSAYDSAVIANAIYYNGSNYIATNVKSSMIQQSNGDVTISTAAGLVGVQTPVSRVFVKNDGKVGVGTTTPTAGLDVATTGTLASAIRIPRDTTANRPVGSAATDLQGMMRYNTTDNKYEVYEGTTGWTSLTTGSVGTSSQWTSVASGIHYSSGSVGIGTSNPYAQFEVRGPSPKIHIASSTTGVGNNIEAGLAIKDNSNMDVGFFGYATSTDLRIYNSQYGISFGANGNPYLMHMTAAGKLGIGTTGPSVGLDVATAGTGSAIRIPRETTANRPTGSATDLQGMMRYNTDLGKYEVYEGTTGWASLSTGSTGTSQWTTLSNGIAYTGGGSVGINTSTPVGALQIRDGGAATQMTVGPSTQSSANAVLALQSKESGAIREAKMTVNWAGELQFEPQWGQDTVLYSMSNPILTAKSTGSVGVGITAPVAKLHVYGTSDMGNFGSLTVSNNIFRITEGASYLAMDGNAIVTNSPLSIGNTANQSLFLATNNTSRFEINGEGRIYTSGPSMTLGSTTAYTGAALAIDSTGTMSSVLLPRASTGSRPVGVNGMIRYNSTTNKFEAYENSAWTNMIGAGGSSQWSTVSNGISYTGGSVGIGTSSPTSALHVTSGNITTTGSLGLGISGAPRSEIEFSGGISGDATNPNLMRFYDDGSNVFGIGTSAWTVNFRSQNYAFYTGASSPEIGMKLEPWGAEIAGWTNLVGGVSIGDGTNTYVSVDSTDSGGYSTTRFSGHLGGAWYQFGTGGAFAAEIGLQGHQSTFALFKQGSADTSWGNADVAFFTNGGASFIRDGWLGIGAGDSPATNLHVNEIQNTTSDYPLAVTQGSLASGNSTRIYLGKDTSTGVYMGYNHNNTASSRSMGLGMINGSSDIMTLRNDGNVGIGTSNPTDKLTVVGGRLGLLANTWNDMYNAVASASANANIYTVRSRGTYSAPTYAQSSDILGSFQMRNHTATSGAGMLSSATQNHTASAAGADLRFTVVPDGATSYIEAMTISQSGSVGIGTTSPTQLLQVYSNSNSSSLTEIENVSTGTSARAGFQAKNNSGNVLIMSMNSSTYSGTGNAEASGATVASSGSGGLSLGASNASANMKFFVGGSTASEERVRITSSGSVGIGVTNPTNILHINGQGRATNSAWTTTSDIRLKDIDGDYNNGLEQILKLHTVKFHYKKNNPLKLPSDKPFYGVIAQELQQVIPEAVQKMPDGYLTVNTDPVNWAVVNAIQDLHGLCKASDEQLARIDAQVKAHSRDIASLKEDSVRKDIEIQELKRQNQLLKDAVCEINPKAKICKE